MAVQTDDPTDLLRRTARQMGIDIDSDYAGLVAAVAAEIAGAGQAGQTLLVGVSGAQGSGKSTFAGLLVTALDALAKRDAVAMSIDDFYLTRAERAELARSVHPLCATRGVPGTHDTALCRRTIDALRQAAPDATTAIPAFSKLEDDRAPEDTWPHYRGRPDVIILEGWCVGVTHRDPSDWQAPINALEERADPDGTWWRWSNAHVAAEYEPLWALFDRMIYIQVPDFETVVESRLRQEDLLARQNPAMAGERMSREEIVEFTAHYERYTHQLRADMPTRADILIARDREYRYSRLR